jgi:hypothetical protein
MRDGIVIAKHKAQYTSTPNITRLVSRTIPSTCGGMERMQILILCHFHLQVKRRKYSFNFTLF